MIFATACSLQGSVQSVLRVLANPEFLRALHINPDIVDRILMSDFNCGYLAALLTVVLLLAVLLLIKLIGFIFFRTKRCSKVIVPLDNEGSIVVSRSAIEATVRNEIKTFSQITVRKLLLFKAGKKYSLKLLCEFDRKGAGMPEIAQELRPKLREVMQNLFGITNLTDISLTVERLREEEEENTPADNTAAGIYPDGSSGL